MRALLLILKLLLKIAVAPVILVLAVFIWLCVGLVYISIASKKESKVYKYNVNPKYPRLLIKYKFAKHAIKLLAEFLEGKTK